MFAAEGRQLDYGMGPRKLVSPSSSFCLCSSSSSSSCVRLAYQRPRPFRTVEFLYLDKQGMIGW